MAKTLLKYTGTGLISKNIHFDPNFNDGLYEVEKDTAEYLINTFTKDFTVIETSTEEKPKAPAKKTTRRRKKKVEVQEDTEATDSE